MQEVKAQIIGQILKQERPFKAQKIHNNLGLGRQLVDYHLKKLLSDGSLEKNGLYYAVADKDSLINALGEIGENTRLKKPSNPDILRQFDIIVSLRMLKHPVANELRTLATDVIDKRIKELKVNRNYLMAATKSDRRAKVILKDRNRVWDEVGEGVAQFMSRAEFEEILDDLAKAEEE